MFCFGITHCYQRLLQNPTLKKSILTVTDVLWITESHRWSTTSFSFEFLTLDPLLLLLLVWRADFKQFLWRLDQEKTSPSLFVLQRLQKKHLFLQPFKTFTKVQSPYCNIFKRNAVLLIYLTNFNILFSCSMIPTELTDLDLRTPVIGASLKQINYNHTLQIVCFEQHRSTWSQTTSRCEKLMHVRKVFRELEVCRYATSWLVLLFYGK